MSSVALANKLRQRLSGRTAWLLACLVSLVGFVAISIWNPAPASADFHTDSIRDGACLEGPPSFSSDGATTASCPESDGSGLKNVIRTALNVLTWITGVAAVFVLILAGFRYVVSGGSSSGVTGAKNMIVYALIGVVVALLAQLIVRFVIGNVGDAAQAPAQAPSSSQTTVYTCINNGGTVTCDHPIPADENSLCDVDPGEGETCEYTLDSE